MVKNIFGELANDLSIKSLMQKFGRFSFDSTSQLRVGGNVGVSGSLTTVTTVTTVGTSNGSFGDAGKASASMLMSQMSFQSGVGRNFGRT